MATAAACGKAAQQGRSPVFIVIESMGAASGARPDQFANVLESDVVTNVQQTVGGQAVLVPTVYEDIGEITMRLSLKDQSTPTGPTRLSEVTFTRYRVVYKRADGRNTPGVDVPYAFDGAVTFTVPLEGSARVTYILVRGQAKLERPLVTLRGLGGALVLSTIAEVTFYGRDQAGNDITASGMISVNFADWGDPA